MKMVEFSASTTGDISEDILIRIFYKSPIQSLIRFGCVSKLWFNLTNNDQQQFSKFHFIESQKKPTLLFSFQYNYDVNRFYYLEKDEHGNDQKLVPYRKKEVQDKYVFGEVNGLVLYWNLGQYSQSYEEWVHFSLEICNPSRLEKLTIVSRLDGRAGQEIFRFLFGYNLFNNEYKVICITKSYKEGYNCYVLTLGSSQPWRQIYNPWPKQYPQRFFECPGSKRVTPISCNGTLFFEMKKDKCVSLVSLDLQAEKFQIIKFPADDEEFTNLYPLEPLEYKGCLCYTKMEKTNPYQGKPALYILKDTINQVWFKETIKFHLPKKVGKSRSS